MGIETTAGELPEGDQNLEKAALAIDMARQLIETARMTAPEQRHRRLGSTLALVLAAAVGLREARADG